MNKTKKHSRSKYVYLTIILSMILLLIYSLFFKHVLIADLLVGIVFLGMVLYYDLHNKISVLAFSLLILAIILSLLGAMGLYAYFIIGIIGYDKLVHLISSFAVAYALLELIKRKHVVLNYGFVILIVMGLGAIVEINEFIGTVYFGINNGGIFTIGDNLTLIKSDLQKYDTYFDMITNLIGALIAVSFVIIKERFEKRDLEYRRTIRLVKRG